MSPRILPAPATTALVALLGLLAALLAVVAPQPAAADTRAMPGHFTGYAFDQCQAPSQSAMDAWWNASPYAGIGIYIAGDLRFCRVQTHLDATWVARQARTGWRLLPLTVGRQASCSTVERYQDHLIDDNPTKGYAAARGQGRREARSTVRAARALGIGKRSVLWYDIEAFPTTSTRCRESALAFLSAWTNTLHNLDFRSGVYSSAASGIAVLDQARRAGRHTMPDFLWVAEWVAASSYRRPPTAVPPSLQSSFYDSAWWVAQGRVMRQYRGDHDERYGGVRINIDTNYLNLGRGSRVPRAQATCGVEIDYDRYRRFTQGSRGEQIRAAQCLLRQLGHYRKKVLRPRFTPATKAAVYRFQTASGLPRHGKLNRRVWVALLTAAPIPAATPVSKYGSATHAVRRIQRALNATGGARLPITGFYGFETTQAVRDYQRAVGLPANGVVAPTTWATLRAGRS
ncbi:MAG: DUF1906 domain-containing protein [Nocardioides sp.]|nr:DUF1906 domain-containing protein [Nocardioides sp.]